MWSGTWSGTESTVAGAVGGGHVVRDVVRHGEHCGRDLSGLVPASSRLQWLLQRQDQGAGWQADT